MVECYALHVKTWHLRNGVVIFTFFHLICKCLCLFFEEGSDKMGEINVEVIWVN